MGDGVRSMAKSSSALASLLTRQQTSPVQQQQQQQQHQQQHDMGDMELPPSPSMASQSPSPLVLSDCSSPAPSSPPPTPAPPAATSSLFYRSDHMPNNGDGSVAGGSSAGFMLESVLTHEHNDPMLSASAPATGPGPAPLSAATSISSGQMRPVVLQERQPANSTSSNGLPGSIQLPTVPLPPQQQQQQPPQMSPAAMAAPPTVQIMQETSTSSNEGGGKPEPPRKDRLTLYGCFAANLTDPKSATKPYIIHVFDKGSYFKSGDEPDTLLMEQLSRGTGVMFDALYAKNNPNRVTFDQVLLKLNNQWLSVPKPGTAIKAMEYVASDTVFFLQATALLKVNLFVQKQSGVQWITDCRFVTNTNIQNAIVHTDFNVLITASSKTTANRRPAAALQQRQQQQQQIQQQQAPSPSASSTSASMLVNGDLTSETLHLSSGTITLHSSNNPAPPAGGGGLLQQSNSNGGAANFNDPLSQPVPTPPAFPNPPTPTLPQMSPAASTGSAVLSRNCDYQLTESQYPAITSEQVTHCTSCAQCNRRFKYAIENFFHFVMSPPCRTFVLKSRAGEDDANNGVASFAHSLYALIARQCSLPRDAQFRCDACSAAQHGPLQYCIHRDQHQPVHGDISLCQFCGVIFRTPHCFYRHKCISSWDLKTTLSKFEKSHLPLPLGTEDAFKIYSNLTEDEKAKILKCPICGKALCYMSGLMAHLKSSSDCFTQLRQQTQSVTNECVDLSSFALSKLQLTPRALKCETCGLDSRNQIAYAIHRDHHTLKKQGMLICKGCNSEYRAPCEFYRHNCSSQKNAIKLQWCPFCEVARHCDRLKESSKVALNSVASPTSITSAASPNVTSPAAFPADASPSPATPATPHILQQQQQHSQLPPSGPPPQYNAANLPVAISSRPTFRPLNCDNIANTSASASVSTPAQSGAASTSSTSAGTELMKRLLASSAPAAGPSQPNRPMVVKADIDAERDELEEALRKIHQGEDDLLGVKKEETMKEESAAGQLDGHSYTGMISDLDVEQLEAKMAKMPSSTPGNNKRKKKDGTASLTRPRKKPVRSADPAEAGSSHQLDSSDQDDCFICTECSPYKILRSSESVSAHRRNRPDHVKINPLRMYANLKVNLEDVTVADGGEAAMNVRNKK